MGAARVECQGKAFQAIIGMLFPTEGYAALAPGYLHRQADVYCLPGKSSLFHSSFFPSIKLAFPSAAELRFFTLHLDSSLFTLRSSLRSSFLQTITDKNC